ncbi:lipopolysaccharide biosynthesis protein [Nocardioides dongxiaopingii]|uniref:lipopolysaccharide biosynthesis protein n=1 Tax=Nocardioides sp. S-1144 TaxID=2582905 RepID=UPI0021CB8B73|nr:lipopolysaccharide biosynthesis protein [Nocardioides sp. S-1144]
MPSPATTDGGTGLRGSAGIAVAMLVMNVATYGFQVVSARLLGPAEYGAVAGLMAFLLVLSVPQLGLQATAARRIAADDDHAQAVERSILRLSYRVALVISLAALAATPLVAHLLRLDSLWPAVLVALAAGPLTVMGGQAGVLQGERRWRSLGLLYLAMGLPRLVLGCVFVAVSPTATAAMLAVLVGLLAPVAVGTVALRRPRAGTEPDADAAPARRVLAEIATSSVVLLAFFVLQNVDILIARRTLDEHTAGLYAGGLIVTKAVLFLPQFVIVVLFPSMSAHASRRAALVRGLLVLAGTGVVCTLGGYLLSPVALVFVGGAEYAEVETRLWLFALLGILLATLQLLVYSALGRQSHRSTYLIWAGVAVIVVAGMLAGSLTGLAAAVGAVDAVLVVVLTALALREVSRPDRAGDPSRLD